MLSLLPESSPRDCGDPELSSWLGELDGTGPESSLPELTTSTLSLLPESSPREGGQPDGSVVDGCGPESSLLGEVLGVRLESSLSDDLDGGPASSLLGPVPELLILVGGKVGKRVESSLPEPGESDIDGTVGDGCGPQSSLLDEDPAGGELVSSLSESGTADGFDPVSSLLREGPAGEPESSLPEAGALDIGGTVGEGRGLKSSLLCDEPDGGPCGGPESSLQETDAPPNLDGEVGDGRGPASPLLGEGPCGGP